MYASFGCGALSAKCTAGANILRYFFMVSRCLFCGIEVAQVSFSVSRSFFWYRDSALCCSALRPSSSWDQPLRVFGDSTSCTLEVKEISILKRRSKNLDTKIKTSRYQLKESPLFYFLGRDTGLYRKPLCQNPLFLVLLFFAVFFCLARLLGADFWEVDLDSNFLVFRVRRFTEWPGPLR